MRRHLAAADHGMEVMLQTGGRTGSSLYDGLLYDQPTFHSEISKAAKHHALKREFAALIRQKSDRNCLPFRKLRVDAIPLQGKTVVRIISTDMSCSSTTWFIFTGSSRGTKANFCAVTARTTAGGVCCGS